ncbi:unnamed protein product, partial [Owenia fusiformis]
IFKMAASMRNAASRIFIRKSILRPNHRPFSSCRLLYDVRETQYSPRVVPVHSTQNGHLSWSQMRHFTQWRHLLAAESTTDGTTDTEAPPSEPEEYHSIITNTERAKGAAEKQEFQAETRKLLDIVAKSLYSEKEVFIRELISNCSDALEKLRYQAMTTPDVADKDVPLEIHIGVDDSKKTFTIQDTGIGMNKTEMLANLGIIAKSGSKEFLEELKDKPDVSSNLIGQFGVGFYSTFMVGEKVDVYSQSHDANEPAHKWTSDGTGTYEISEAEGVQRGTKIVVHLKGDSYDFAKEDVIKDIIKKYSNFVGVPIYVNGKKANVIQALWTLEPKDVTEDMHEEFFRFISNAYDKPRYTLHYKTDAPLNIRALFYVPQYKPTLFDMSQDRESGVTLYSRKVMIMNKSSRILPAWLRFVKGVVDSEDIPLNLSRELLQDSHLIRKLRNVLTSRLIRFFLEKSKKDPASYLEFYEDYGLYFREGIVSEPEQSAREEIAKLLRFESSKMPSNERTSFDDYIERMEAGGRNIFYLHAPSRALAEASPYMEALKKKDIEVLFCFEPYDEMVLMNLSQYAKKNIRSVENEVVAEAQEDAKVDESDEGSISQTDADSLGAWLKLTLGTRVNKVKVTNALTSTPCIVTVQELGMMRHFLRTQLHDKSDEEKYRVLNPTLEINPSHPIVVKLNSIRDSNPQLAKLVAEQIYDNAMISAGLIMDPRTIVGRLNDLLSKALEKH